MAAVTGAVLGGVGLGASIYTGERARSAARRSEQAQLGAAKDAREATAAQFEQIRGDLGPYRAAGEAGVPLLTEFNTNPQAQYDFLQNNPIFQASLNTRDRASVGLAARQGRIGTGDFSAQLQENYLMSAMPLLQQREQQLLNLAQIGGNAAAQTGQAGLAATNAINDYGIQGANARAAGIAARQQAEQQTINGVLQGVSGIAGVFAPKPAGI